MNVATRPTNPIKVKSRNRVVWLTTWYDDDGIRRAHRIGFVDGPKKITAQRAQLVWENWKRTTWENRPDVRNPADKPVTVTAIAARYLRHAGRTFRKRGRPTSHVGNVRQAMRALRDYAGPLAAGEFEAPALAHLRDAMVFGASGQPRSASTVNDRLRIIQAAFAKAREWGLISAPQAADLASVACVKAARKGTVGAKRKRKIVSVPRETVDATVAQMPPVLSDMVDLLWWSGMRPGEVCDLRGQDLLIEGDDWLYAPEFYKTDHLEDTKERVVALGPHARGIVERHLKPDLSAPLFSPADAMAERRAARTKARAQSGTKAGYGNTVGSNRKEAPQLVPGGKYETETFRRAIHYACKLAGIPKWAPNRLRHAAATRIERKVDIDAARAVLGHTSERTTRIYLDPDVQKAIRAAREVG